MTRDIESPFFCILAILFGWEEKPNLPGSPHITKKGLNMLEQLIVRSIRTFVGKKRSHSFEYHPRKIFPPCFIHPFGQVLVFFSRVQLNRPWSYKTRPRYEFQYISWDQFRTIFLARLVFLLDEKCKI